MCFITSCSSAPKVYNLSKSELKLFVDDVEKKEQEKDEDNDDEIKLINQFCAENRFQTNIVYPLHGDDYDESIITHDFIPFKAYTGQGCIYFHSKNLKNVSLYLNGIKLNSKKICKNEYSKIYIADIAKNGQNLLFVSNIEAKKDSKGRRKKVFLNIRIPYPKILKLSTKEIRKVKEESHINDRAFQIIDDLTKAEIQNGFPSAQIVIIKDGKMLKSSPYGFISTVDERGYPLKYNKRQKINNDTLFDLASNTKMYSVNLAMQKLVSEGKLCISDKVQKFFPEFKEEKKAKYKGKNDISLYDLLKHQAGFPAGGRYAYKCKKFRKKKKTKNEAKNITNKEITLKLICETPIVYDRGTQSIYSDIDYMLLGLVIEKVTGMPLDEYVEKNIYKALNLKRICYKPLTKGFRKNEITASEINGIKRSKDKKYKNEKYLPIHGEVHDPESYGAMNQVSGHAGLFANAESIAVLAQTILNGGGYDCVKLFDSQVLNLFTSPSSELSTSGLGWRRQGAHKTYSWAFSQLASTDTVGHTGWTGTFTQIDLKNNMIIVIFTSAKNTPALRGRRFRWKFEGDFYLLKKYGAISSFIYAGINNYNDEILDKMLIELLSERYKLLKNDPFYNNKGFRKDLKAIFETVKKQSRHSRRLRKFLRSDFAKGILTELEKK